MMEVDKHDIELDDVFVKGLPKRPVLDEGVKLELENGPKGNVYIGFNVEEIRFTKAGPVHSKMLFGIEGKLDEVFDMSLKDVVIGQLERQYEKVESNVYVQDGRMCVDVFDEG